jgi:hypothetical protein
MSNIEAKLKNIEKLMGNAKPVYAVLVKDDEILDEVLQKFNKKYGSRLHWTYVQNWEYIKTAEKAKLYLSPNVKLEDFLFKKWKKKNEQLTE